MSQTVALSKFASVANGVYNSVTANSTAITAINVGGQAVGTVTSVASGNGMSGGPVTSTGSLSVLANTGIVANSTGVFVNPASSITFTGTPTFNGTTSTAATVITNTLEPTTVSATAATGTIAFDVTTQSVLYYTSNASANWTVNFRGSSGTSLNTLMSVGQSITVAFLVTQGTTPYYASAHQIDGSSVTPKWQGGTAPTAGNASGIDIYTYTIIKTGSATFTLLAAQTQFK